MKNKLLIIGKVTKITRSKITTQPKKKYRIIIHQKPTKTDKDEKQNCFTVYDYDGRTTINSIKNKLLKMLK